jgi:regulator of protease activity HflC (stomatin/prohibitin superfamily)
VGLSRSADRVSVETKDVDPVVTTVLIVVIALVVLIVGSAVRMVQQYQRGGVLRFGRLLPEVRQPGLRLMIPVADRMVKVPVQTIVMDVPPQGAITKDNVTLSVDAVVYFRVTDPVKAVVNVENYLGAISQVARTSLRSVIGRADLDTMLSDREQVNAELRAVIDTPTDDWGITVDRVEIKDVALPETMKRSMSKQAEAERERRSRIITADGEFQASKKLASAATNMAATPAALQLRLLQTIVEVAAEKNSTVVLPFPVELLRFLEQATGTAAVAASRAEPETAQPPAPATTRNAPPGETATSPAG